MIYKIKTEMNSLLNPVNHKSWLILSLRRKLAVPKVTSQPWAEGWNRFEVLESRSLF